MLVGALFVWFEFLAMLVNKCRCCCLLCSYYRVVGSVVLESVLVVAE